MTVGELCRALNVLDGDTEVCIADAADVAEAEQEADDCDTHVSYDAHSIRSVLVGRSVDGEPMVVLTMGDVL